jgi:iron-sulfur cluster repair protein YtfE (RIC family)
MKGDDVTTEREAADAMLAHHRALRADVGARVAAVREAVAGGRPYAGAVADLVAVLEHEVLPHARAEEQSIYRAAGGLAGLAGTVDEMVGEHRVLESKIGVLGSAPSGQVALDRAEELETLFGEHVGKENEVLLPALLADHGVDLVALLHDMHRLTEEGSGR